MGGVFTCWRVQSCSDRHAGGYGFQVHIAQPLACDSLIGCIVLLCSPIFVSALRATQHGDANAYLRTRIDGKHRPSFERVPSARCLRLILCLFIGRSACQALRDSNWISLLLLQVLGLGGCSCTPPYLLAVSCSASCDANVELPQAGAMILVCGWQVRSLRWHRLDIAHS